MARGTLRVTRPDYGGQVDNEPPDWGFWCFVIAVIDLAVKVMTQR